MLRDQSRVRAPFQPAAATGSPVHRRALSNNRNNRSKIVPTSSISETRQFVCETSRSMRVRWSSRGRQAISAAWLDGDAAVDTSMSGRRVVREPDALIAKRGTPRMIVSDDGTELTSNAVPG